MCVFSYVHLTFFSCDLDVDPMTLILDFDLDVLMTYPQTEDEVGRRHSNVGA